MISGQQFFSAVSREWTERFKTAGLELPDPFASEDVLRPILEKALVTLITTEGPPPFKPLGLVDKGRKWRAMSAMQKAVRFGDPETAARVAAALVNVGCASDARRRLAVISLEDVGLANPWAATLVNLWCSNPKLRRRIKRPIAEQAGWCAAALATGAKNRDLCLMNVWVFDMNAPCKEEIGLFRTLPQHEAVAAAVDASGSFRSRMAALFALSGVAKWGSMPLAKGAGIAAHKHVLALGDAPPLFGILAEANHKSCQDALWVPILLSWELMLAASLQKEHPPLSLAKIGPVHAATYDKHTAEGKRSMAAFAKGFPPFRDACAARGLDAEAVGHTLAFYAEGAVVSPHLVNVAVREFQDAFMQVRLGRVGVTNFETWDVLKSVFAAGLPKLNQFRTFHAS